MSRLRSDIALGWLDSMKESSEEANDRQTKMMYRSLVLFRVLMTLCAGLVVCAGWYFEDRLHSYRVGSPSPRTYLAQSSSRFVDRAATNEVKSQAASQIVNVRVRDDLATKTVVDRITELRERHTLSSMSSELSEIFASLSDDVRERVIYTAINIAEHNFDRSTNRMEQTSVIWDALREVDIPQSEKNIVFQIVDALLVPTVLDDAEMTSVLRNKVVEQIPSVVREIRVGAVLVDQGQIVTPEIAEVLREQGYPDATIPWRNLGFIVLVTFIWTLWVTWGGVHFGWSLAGKKWLYIGTIIVIDWVTQRCFAVWNLDSLSILATVGWMFLTLAPSLAFQVSLGGCLVGYLLAFPNMTSQIAVGCVLCVGVSVASFFLLQEATSRIMIWRNIFSLGIWTTVASLFARWGFGLQVTWDMLGIFIVLSVFWSSIVVAMLPLWETLVDIISPLRLLELSHPSQPLLKRLQLEAPGTYHHTITVSTLAEAVADKVGMNGLLVKTGAYYHDIGKLKRPHYFVENQSPGDNLHDRLPPIESVKNIISHVEDGLKLADEYKIPEAIKDFIKEHHGNTCVTYFYQKAVNADKDAGGDGSSVDRSQFCYPWRVPQSRETALLMLADSTEAALRGREKSAENQYFENIQEAEKLVSGVCDSKIAAGQLSDVDFTFRELTAIKNAFAEVLMSMYHTRQISQLRPSQDEQKEAKAEPQESAPAPTPPAQTAVPVIPPRVIDVVDVPDAD